MISSFAHHSFWRAVFWPFAFLAVLSSVTFAQVFTATAAPSCPTSCQPIQLVRAESVNRNGSVEIKVSWEVASLPSGMAITGFEVMAKASTKSGREREQRVQVGSSVRTASIILNDFLTGDLKTFRARVVARFTANAPLITISPTSQTVVKSGRDHLLDLKWTIPSSVQNISPCIFTGFQITGTAFSSDGRKISGRNSIFDRTLTTFKLRLSEGDAGRDPVFTRTEASLKVISGTAGGAECGVSSGEENVGGTIANTTLTRDQIKALLEQNTKLVEMTSNGLQVTAKFQLANTPHATAKSAFMAVNPVRRNGNAKQSELQSRSSLTPILTTFLFAFSADQLVTDARGAVNAIAGQLDVTYQPVEGDLIKITRVLTVPFNGSVGSTAAANDSNSTGSATAKTGTTNNTNSTNNSTAKSGASGTSTAPPASSTAKPTKKRN
jgi:hypothetical protein